MIWIHVSELAIDRLLAGELAPDEGAAMRDHAAGCTRCRALLDDALAAQRAFAAEPPPLGLVVPLHRRRRGAIAAGAALVAAAACVAMLVRPRAPAAPAVRTKGSAILGFFVDHGGQVRRGGPTEVIAPGDRIELATTTTVPVWFAALGEDAAGARSVYVPPRPIAPGRERLLPFAIELDGATGRDTITGVFCAQSFDAGALDPREPPDGCTIDRFTLEEVP